MTTRKETAEHDSTAQSAQKAYQNANQRLRDKYFGEFVNILNEERSKVGLQSTLPNPIPEGWTVTVTSTNGSEG